MVHEHSSSEDFKQLRNVLKNSFLGIKTDMNQVKASQSTLLKSYNELRSNLDSIKRNSATKDDFNQIQKKVNTLNKDLDELKKVESRVSDLTQKAEKSIKGVDSRYLTKNASEKENRRVKTSLTDLKNKIDDVDTQVKHAFTLEQYAVLAKDIENELGVIKKDIGDAEEKRKKDIKDAEAKRTSDIKKDIKDHTSGFDGKFEKLKEEVSKLNQEVSERSKVNQVEKLVNDINKEFDSMKEKQFEETRKIKNELETLKQFVRKDQVENLIGDLNKEFDGVKQKETSNAERLKNKIERLDNRISVLEDKREVIAAQPKNIKGVKKSKSVKANLVVAKPVEKEIKGGAKKEGRFEKPLMMFANISIIVSFAILIASIVAFFSGRESLMNGMIITAIIVFVVGVITRLIIILTKNKD